MDKTKRNSLKAYTEDGALVMEVYAIEYKDGKLIIDGNALGSMRMDIIVSAEEVADNLGMLVNLKTMKFIAKIPGALFGRKKRRESAAAAAKSENKMEW